MSFIDRLNEDIKTALKSGNSEKAGVLRFLSAQIHNKEIEKRSTAPGGQASPTGGQAGMTETLTDAEAIEVLQKEAKKRNESIALFEKGGRMDLAEKEKKEMKMISEYLPQQMSREEVAAVVNRLHDGGLADFNSLIKESMKELKGRADGSLVSGVIKEILD